MAYEIVCESESKRYRSDCASVLTKTCEILKSKNIIAQFSLVGSGAKNLITRNGNGPYDLDYNLVVIKADERYWKDLRLLKNTVRNALNKAERKNFFSDAMDSRSCLTTLLHFNDSPNVEFSFDVAILTKNRNGDYMRLIHTVPRRSPAVRPAPVPGNTHGTLPRDRTPAHRGYGRSRPPNSGTRHSRDG